MDSGTAWSFIISSIIGLVILYIVIRTAAFDALRKHTLWAEDRAARPDHYDPDKPLRGPVSPGD